MVICPKCRSDRTAPILYGYPSHEAFEAEEQRTGFRSPYDYL